MARDQVLKNSIFWGALYIQLSILGSRQISRKMLCKQVTATPTRENVPKKFETREKKTYEFPGVFGRDAARRRFSSLVAYFKLVE